jgi:hypothetical protein
MKVAVNRCYGGFGLSAKAIYRMAELGNKEMIEKVGEYEDRLHNPEKQDEIEKKYGVELYGSIWQTPRNDPILIQVIEELGKEANDEYAEIEIVDIPDDIDFEIEEYDGREWVSEKHRTW